MTRWFLKIGFVKAFVGMVILAILLSLSFTVAVLLILDREISTTAVSLSVGIPGAIAVLFSTITLKAIYDLEEAEKQMREQAMKDHLTGLKNRRYFFKIAERELELAKRYGTEFALVVLDIDEFKNVNDTYGHVVGNQMLQELAKTCSLVIRKADVFARLGGDEFAILISHSKKVDLDAYRRRLLQTIKNTHVRANGQVVSITASIGAKRYTDKLNTIDQILHLADREMYFNKRHKKKTRPNPIFTGRSLVL